MLRRGRAETRDFPLYFTSRCVHLTEFLAAVDAQLRDYLLRRQYHQRLQAVRAQARDQYAQMGDLLSGRGAARVRPGGHAPGATASARGCVRGRGSASAATSSRFSRSAPRSISFSPTGWGRASPRTARRR